MFDVMGRKTIQHHPATGTTRFQYDQAGRLTHTTDAKGHTHSQNYNTYGEVSQTFTDGVMTREFDYDLMGRLNRKVDAEGIRTIYLYNPEGQLSHKVLERVEKERINQSSSFLSAVTTRHVTQFQYDKRGNVIHQQVLKDERNGAILSVSETGKMVRSGNLKYTSQWQRKYDHRGRVVSETNGEGVERVTDYVAGGRIKTVKLSGAVQERIELDAMGRTLWLTNGAGEKTEYEYDDTRHRVTVVSPGGIRTVTEKNAHGETVTITDGLGHQRGFEYNAQGKVTRTTFLAKGDDEPQTLSSTDYPAQTGLLTFSTNADGIRTEYRYDSVGRKWKVIRDTNGGKLSTTYVYNADGQRISENSEGRVTTMRFDSQGRKIWTEQGGVGTEFIYDLNGQIIKQVEGALAANGQIQQERVTEYDRDATGAILKKLVRSGQDWNGRASNRSVSYRYNAAGQVIEKQTGQGGIARTVYDDKGRVQFEINALNYVTAYEYDAANRITKTTRYAKALSGLTEWTVDRVRLALSGDVRTTEHRYDEAGRLAFDIDGLGYVTGYEYDAANRVIRTTRYAKPVTDIDWFTTSADNRVSESIYDAKGQLRFSINEKGQVSERTYDAMGRVTHMIRYDQSVTLEDRSEASLSRFKSHLAQEVEAGRVRSELSVFDALGRLRFELDGEGYLVEYQYNRHSEQTRKIVYVENSSLKREFALLKANNADYQAEKAFLDAYVQNQGEEDAQTTSYFYDERGNKIIERSAKVDYLDLDVSGHESLQTDQNLITKFQYDSLGNVTGIKHASGTSMESEESFVFDVQGNQGQSIGVGGSRVYFDEQGLAIVHVTLQGERRDKVYDSLGQLRFDVDELGFITEHKYNAFGEKYLQVRYGSAIPSRTIGQPVLLEEIESFIKRAGAELESRTIAYEFDDGGRQKSVKTYGSATPDQRIDTVQYNTFGDKVQSNKSDGVDTFVSNQQLFSRNGTLFANKNAENYITYYEYNGYGEIKNKVEYADKYLGDWTESALTEWMAGQIKDERRVEYVYDKNGNKRKTILKNAQFHKVVSDAVNESWADIVSNSFFDHAGRVVLSAVSSGSKSDDDIRAYKSSQKYQYDALGRLTSTWSAEKSVADLRPETLGNVSQSFERLQTRFFYDARGNQVKVVAGDRTNYTYYNSEGLRTGGKDAEGHFSRVNMDNMNRVTSEAQHVSSSGSPQGLSYSHDMVNEYRYDATGRQVATRQKASSGDIERSVEYNAYGEIISRKLNGIVTESYQYDSLGNVIKEIKNRIQKTYQYSLGGKVTGESTYYWDNESERLLPSTTNRDYDLLGNLIREEKPGVELYDNVYEELQRGQKPTYSLVKPITEQELDRWGNVVKKTVNGVQYEFEYNSKNQMVKQIGPRVKVIEDNGSITFRRPVTLFYYDLRGNRIAVQDANGNWQKTIYDLSGTKIVDINSEGYETFYVRNIHGDMVGRYQPGEFGELYHYDKKSQLLARAKLALSFSDIFVYERYTYDQAGRRNSETRYGNAGYQSFVKYDEVSNVLETHGKGVHRKYEYNDRGEKVSEAWLRDGVEKSKKQYRYDQQSGKKIEDILADGSKIAYRYDYAGFLTAKSGAGIDVEYKYYNDGKLRMHHSADKIETYSYDLNGREVWRQLKTNGDLQRHNGAMLTRTYWDSLGRVHRLKTYEAKLGWRSLNSAEIKYEYDAVGNRRKVTSKHLGRTKHQWYHYDSENRKIASHEEVNDLRVDILKMSGPSGSRVIEYDVAGRKIAEIEWGTEKKERKISYDVESGHLASITEYTTYGSEEVITRKFDQAKTITGHTTYSSDENIEFAYRSGKVTETKRNKSLTTSTYEDGLLKQQIVWKHQVGGVKDHDSTFNYHYTGQIASQQTFIYRPGDSIWDTVKYKYSKRDPLKRSRIIHSRVMVDQFNQNNPSSNRWVDGVTGFTYDSAGDLLSVESTKSESRRFVLSNFDGQIKLQLKDSSNLTANLAAAGNQVGILSAYELDSDLLDNSVSDTGTQPGTYTVKSGDSLQKISQALFGDTRYWYLIADTNGLSPSEKPLTGQVLLVPNIHTQTFNSAESFKPYNESEVLGDINPEPMPPPPPKKSCNPVAQIIMVAVAVVVTVYTAGAAAAAMGSMAGAAGTGVAGAATIGAAGTGVLSGAAVAGSTMAGIAAAAIGGAVGSAASQLVGRALGVVDHFSWGQVALGSLAAAATAGLGAMVRTEGISFSNQFSESFAQNAVNYSSNYLGSKALGMDASFNWKGFAASMVGGLVSSASSKYLTQTGEPMMKFLGAAASGYAGGAAAPLMRGASLRGRTGQILTDSFGNALANVAKGAIIDEEMRVKRQMMFEKARKADLRPAIPVRVKKDPTVIVTPLSAADDPSNWRWDEQDLLFEEREAALAQHFARREDTEKAFVASLNDPYKDAISGVPILPTDWTDMNQPLTPGPWRDGYVFGKDRLTGPKLTIGDEGHVLGAASRLEAISQRVGTTVVNSADIFEHVDEFGQVLNSRTKHISTNYVLNYNALSDLKVGSPNLVKTALPHSSIYGPGGSEMIRIYGDNLTYSTSAIALDKNSASFTYSKYLGRVGDALELGVDTYNNFNQDGVSSRAFIATGVDASQMILSSGASTVVGTFVGGLAGTGTAATGVGAPAAPAVALTTGVATGVYVDYQIDSFYEAHLREPIINGLTSAYDFGKEAYAYFTD
ncbi:LysM peptidoglycan-binding domain-containing protein [Vibrio caribbeanicus]|uniref:LysM peptidoglycan-binding domain-containing protein n=1 Tax=Vibrio caribbeanicus TaxID=701175 RepID=UPI0030D8120A